jgi:adenosylmethionine-8-amino-7-oxononanoate aminotransferase
MPPSRANPPIYPHDGQDGNLDDNLMTDPASVAGPLGAISAPAASDCEHLIHGYTNLARHRDVGPRIIVRGDGIHVIDGEGRRYIEAAAGMWCASFGFSEEALVEAAIQQFRELPYYHTLAAQSVVPAIRLAERLSAIVPIADGDVYLTLSGSEANDFLVKFLWYYNNARGRPNKKKVISRIDAPVDAAAFKSLAEDEGVIVRVVRAGNSVALSPLVITEREVAALFDRMERALTRAAAGQSARQAGPPR